MDNPHRIGILAIPGFALMSYAALTEPLRAATLLGATPPYAVDIFCTGDVPAAASQGMCVAPTRPLAEAGSVGRLFVVAGGRPEHFDDAGTLAALRRADRAGVTLGGVSGGPVVLATAGLMTGRRMTVHWEHADALREIAPRAALDRALYVIDRGRITCAGGTAPMDMMHALIAADHGAALARAVSDWFLHTEVRPAAGPQRAGLAERLGTTHPALLEAAAALEAETAQPPALADLARRAGVSPRHLLRLFREHLGTTPMAYGRQARLETARRLIRGAPLPLSAIAYATGFASPAHLANAHRAAYGVPPSALRGRAG